MKRRLATAKAASWITLGICALLHLASCTSAEPAKDDVAIAGQEDQDQEDGTKTEDKAQDSANKDAAPTQDQAQEAATPPQEAPAPAPATQEQTAQSTPAPVLNNNPQPLIPETAANDQAQDQSKGKTFEYVVKKGDWLSKIAKKVYGDMYKWQMIADANPDITNPNRIKIGQKIMVPILNDQARDFAGKYKPGHTEPKLKHYKKHGHKAHKMSQQTEKTHGAFFAASSVKGASALELGERAKAAQAAHLKTLSFLATPNRVRYERRL